MPNEIEKLRNEVNELKRVILELALNDRYQFNRCLNIADGVNVCLSGKTGTQFGTASTQKISFYGVAPVVQASKISDPSGQANGLDTEARSAITAIIDALEGIGISSV